MNDSRVDDGYIYYEDLLHYAEQKGKEETGQPYYDIMLVFLDDNRVKEYLSDNNYKLYNYYLNKTKGG